MLCVFEGSYECAHMGVDVCVGALQIHMCI